MEDPIYVMVTKRTNIIIDFNLVIKIEGITVGCIFRNIPIADIRRMVDKVYNNEIASIVSYPTINIFSYRMDYSPRTESILITSNPLGLTITLSNDNTMLLIQKFSKILGDKKNKI